MQVKLNTNNHLTPSFGMATLTKQGTEVAKQFLSEIPKLSDGGALVKKNITPKVLRGVMSEASSIDTQSILDGFFKQGKSNFKIDNATFIKKQILTLKSSHAIKRFLKWQCQDATPQKSGLDLTKQTPMGKNVINHLIEIFDKNITNDKLSRKECQKILKLAEPYMSASEVAPRVAITSSKLYLK